MTSNGCTMTALGTTYTDFGPLSTTIAPVCCSQCGRSLAGQSSVTYINGQPWCAWCQQACFGPGGGRCPEALIWIFENAPLIRERMQNDPGRTSNAPPDMRLPYQYVRNVS